MNIKIKNPKDHRKLILQGSLDIARSKIEQDSSFKELSLLFNQVKKSYNLSSADLLGYIDEKEILLPDCIFIKELSVFQSIVKFLKENCELKNNDIASLMHRSQKSIWQAYNNSKKVFPKKFKIIASRYCIPVSQLIPSFTILESVVFYLKEKCLLNYHQIAILLERDERTIWTVYQRVKKRIGNILL